MTNNKGYNVNKFGAIVLKTATNSFIDFGKEIEQSELLILLLGLGWNYINDNHDDAKQELINLYEEPENIVSSNFVEFLKTSESDDIFNIHTYEQFYGQMSYARIIDNVLTYFKDILGEIIIKQPNILKSNETETYEFILNYDSIEEIRIALSEKKIESLFYKGIKDIEDFFKSRLNVDLFTSDEDRKEFNQAIKNRNIIVHNRGRINSEYLREFPDSNFKIGETLLFSYEAISNIHLIINNFVAHLDMNLANKYNLDVVNNI